MSHARFGTLDEALDALQREAAEFSREAPREAFDAKVRRFEPAQLVAARLELAGPQRLAPQIRAGVDIRGDGSSEAFVGRIRRRVVAERSGEDAFDALRREVTGSASRR